MVFTFSHGELTSFLDVELYILKLGEWPSHTVDKHSQRRDTVPSLVYIQIGMRFYEYSCF